MSGRGLFRKTDSPWQHFLGELDLELFIGGIGLQIPAWSQHQFSGDPYWRLYLPVAGEFRLLFPEESFPVECGKVSLVPALRPFRYQPIAPCTHLWLHFMSENLRFLPAFRGPLALPEAEFDHPRRLFRRALNQLKGEVGVAAALESKVILLRLLEPFLAAFGGDREPRETGTFSRVLDYIDLKLENDLSVSELAALTGLERAEFSAEFRRRFGIPPKQYISTRRLSRAKMLLLRTSEPVKEIAAEAGYPNELFFYRIFRKYTGMTPGEYRRRNTFE